MVVASAWSSLEIVKLVVAALTPIVLFGLGFVVNRASRRVEDLQWSNRKLIERRLELYDEMAPKLNDLFCFFRRVGQFQEVTPPEALKRKRELDRTFFANAPLFEPAFADAYQRFMNVCFAAFQGVGQAAKLRAHLQPQEAERGERWDPGWAAMFATGQESTLDEVTHAYDELMDVFATELGVRPPPRRPRRRLWRASEEAER